MVRIGVKRLAAADMWGRAGTRRRRRLIRAEFVIGAVGCLALGAISMLAGSTSSVVFGIWLTGVGANYVPLAIHAQRLFRCDALEQQMKGVSIDQELRWATGKQLWIAVPFAVAVSAIDEHRRPGSRGR